MEVKEKKLKQISVESLEIELQKAISELTKSEFNKTFIKSYKFTSENSYQESITFETEINVHDW